MQAIECDICGKVIKRIDNVREIQIRKKNSFCDTRPTLEKTLDVCMRCLNQWIPKGESDEKK